jgi:hypothetical protein
LPNEFEKTFKEEIWGCFKYIGIPMDTLMNMPVADRKYYIMLHNKTEDTNDSKTHDEIEDYEYDKFKMINQVKDW